MEEFQIRAWELIIPGCGATSALIRRASLAARWLYEPQPISNHPVGLGSTTRGAVSTRAISVFVAGLLL